MEDIKTVKIYCIDDCVKMVGGKCKNCEGVIVKVMKLFCSVRLTKDKKGNPVFSDKPNKVKREHIIVITHPAVEMPTSEDLKAVDDLEPNIEEVDKETGELNPNLVYDVEDVISKKNAILVDEHGVKSEFPTIDDCINLRDENERLKLQVEALVGWQSHASAECAKHRKDYMDLKKRFDEHIVSKKDELIDLIKNL